MPNEDDLENLFTGPNSGAYERTETRTGPPLDYVAEKLRKAVEGLHEWSKTEASMFAQAAFRNGIVGFLALHNLLAYADDNDLFPRLTALSRDQFRDWLNGIEERGSLRG